ncbi:HU family DNA-binding protein [Phocaeicola sp.]
MAILYSLSRKTSMGETRLYFASVRSTGTVSADELCQRIALRCGLRRPVLKAALVAFSEAMESELSMGNIVDLGEIGRFQVSCSSSGVEREEEFVSSKHMKEAKILFRPGRGLKGMLKCLEYKRVSVR